MYRVVDWDKHYENNRSREIKHSSYVLVPNKQDGDGYTTLLDHQDGAAHFGAWIAILQVASKCDPRGTLSRDGARPHDDGSLSRVTRIPKPIMAAAIDRLVHEVRWLEIVSESPANQQVTTMP